MDNCRICENCKISKTIEDFIGTQKECYKCVFAKKLTQKNCRTEPRYCKQCEKEIPPERWAYCSKDCAKEAKKLRIHWTNKCKVDTKGWKRRFNFFS